MQAQIRPSLPELTTRSRGQVIDTVWASATKVALMRRRGPYQRKKMRLKYPSNGENINTRVVKCAKVLELNLL